jgi:hypothetical protein
MTVEIASGTVDYSVKVTGSIMDLLRQHPAQDSMESMRSLERMHASDSTKLKARHSTPVLWMSLHLHDITVKKAGMPFKK